jgi:fermentation-respiration switch protein FrsA (DUF1100 family)
MFVLPAVKRFQIAPLVSLLTQLPGADFRLTIELPNSFLKESAMIEFSVPISLFGAAFTWLLASPRVAEPVYRPVLFEPLRFPQGDWSMSWLDGLEYEDVSFLTSGGHRLHGWLFPRDDAKVTVVVHHGNTGNIADLGVLIKLLSSTQANVFVYDYRGYGKSESSPSVAGICEDGLAAHDFIVNSLADTPIVQYGESLGGAVACYVSLRRSSAGLILQSAFSDIRRIAIESYPIFRIWPRALFARPYFDNIAAVAMFRAPLLLVHGKKDIDVQWSHANALFNAANEPKHLEMLPNTAHSEIAEPDFTLFRNNVSRFIELIRQDARIQRSKSGSERLLAVR